MKTLLILLTLFASGCATLNNFMKPYGDEGQRCGATFLNHPNLEQIACMERNGPLDEKTQTRKVKLLAEKEKKDQEARELMERQISFSKVRMVDPIGGAVTGPPWVPMELFNERMLGFCVEQKKTAYKVTEVNQNQKYVGTSNGSSAYCNGYGCVGSSNSRANYQTITEVLFNCI